MRLSSVLLAVALSATSATSLSLGLSNNDAQVALEGPSSLDVPGQNPLTYCSEPSDWTLTIDFVDLDPNPPKKGQNLTIHAAGTLHQDLEPGAKVSLTVKYGVITLIKKTEDLCDNAGRIDLECPIKKGHMEMTKSVAIPREVPPGHYTTIADVLDKDGKQITCLKSQIYF